MNSIKLQNRINTTFMNSKISKTFDPHRLLLNLSDETDFNVSSKKEKTVTDNPRIIIYVNQIKNKITFRIKTKFYLELLTPETIKLLGSIKSKIIEKENCENVPPLEITEFHCKIVKNSYQQNSRVLYIFVPRKQFDQL